MSWLKEQFAALRDFFRTGFRKIVIWCAAGFAAAIVLGFAAAMIRPDMAMEAFSEFGRYLDESGVVDDVGQLSVFALLMNNWRAMLISVLYGIVPFLFLPLVSLLSNGVLLGGMAGIYQTAGMSMAALTAGVLPHGVFEISALILSVACGVKLCWNMCLIVTSSQKKVPFVELAEELLRVLVMVIAPLTIAAAFIECYVTPAVMGWFL